MVSTINWHMDKKIGTLRGMYLRKNSKTSGNVQNVTNNRTNEIIAIFN